MGAQVEPVYTVRIGLDTFSRGMMGKLPKFSALSQFLIDEGDLACLLWYWSGLRGVGT